MAKTIAQSTTTGTVADVAEGTFIAVSVILDDDGKPVLAAEGAEDAELWFGALRLSKTEGLVLKFGNEKRILPSAERGITWVPQSELLKHTDTLTAEVKHVSLCQHTHDTAITGVPVTWYPRVMKPGATSYSGVCAWCAARDNSACIGGGKAVVGTVILGRTVRMQDSCHAKRQNAKAEAIARSKAREQEKEALRQQQEDARIAAAAKPAPAKKAASKTA